MRHLSIWARLGRSLGARIVAPTASVSAIGPGARTTGALALHAANLDHAARGAEAA